MARSAKPRKSASEVVTPSRASAATARARTARPRPRARQGFRLNPAWVVLGIVAVVAIVIVGVLVYASSNGSGGQESSRYPYSVGQPGPGAQAPPIQLSATDGSRFDIAAWRGKTVLLYFEEGVGCEPCWTPIKDIQSNFSQFQALGVDQVVTITGDPMDALKQKVSLEGITSPVLSDPGLRVSSTYRANQYGMMGAGADGHTFIVVGPDGVIRWRADYGGAPKYTMYLPVSSLVADMRQGLAKNA